MSAPLILDNVSAGYGAVPALRNASAMFKVGSVIGLVGPNGAGKTTLLRAALGLIPLDGGAVRVMDRSLSDCSRDFLSRTLAYLPQDGAAQWPMLARRVVALGRMPHRDRTDAEDDAAIDDALARCDATQFAVRRMDELSAGERARVLLARALATQAPVLLVDEPAAHLDPAHQLQLMELMRAEAARGTCVIVTLHDLSLASRFCDDIVVLHAGEVVTQGPPDEALSDAYLASVFGVAARRMDGAAGLIAWSRV